MNNLGYLYAFNYIGNGGVMFCPALTSRQSPYSASHYSPLLTTPPSAEFPGENPYIRASYSFNPRVVDPNSDLHRRFRKTSQFVGVKVLGLDLIGQGSTENTIPHYRDKGLNSMMTDGSVVFSKSPMVWGIVRQGGGLQGNMREVDRLCDLIDGGL